MELSEAVTSGAVNFETHLNQLIDHILDLIFTGGILHGYDHVFSLIPTVLESLRTFASLTMTMLLD